VIDVVPIDFVGEEPVEREGKLTSRFRRQLIYFTKDDVTIRRPSGRVFPSERETISYVSITKMAP
jgi:hypothetical protein